MRLVRLSPLFLPCALAFAQNSELFDKAPPEIDEALRARVTIFYNAHISGKYREAFQVVADDAQDDFLGASKDAFKSCEVSKIGYSENFTKATVTEACKGEYRWHGTHMPVTIPTLSTWKFVDGKWWWYHIKEDAVLTPWGISRMTPENSSGPAQMPVIPPDPVVAAQNILRMVDVDRTEVELKGYEASKGEVHVTNAMPGLVTVTVDPLPVKGISVKVEPANIGQNGKSTIVFSYDPNDPALACNSCTSHIALPPVTANIRIQPTGRVLPVNITFAVPPELQKILPKQPPTRKP